MTANDGITCEERISENMIADLFRYLLIGTVLNNSMICVKLLIGHRLRGRCQVIYLPIPIDESVFLRTIPNRPRNKAMNSISLVYFIDELVIY